MATLTLANIETRCANQLRIPTTTATEMTKLDALINEVYRDVAMRYPDWWWLRKRQVVNTVASVTAGTVAATNGSTTVTFSIAPTGSVAGRVLLVTGNNLDWSAVYRISAHTALSATATLDAAYTGTTVTASAFNVYEDAYSVATDTNRVISVRRFGYRWPLEFIGSSEMDALKNYDTQVGKPQVVALRDFATSGDPTTAKQLIVHPYPDNTYRLELDYTQTLNTEVSGTTRFLIPDDYVQILIYGTLARGYPIFLNDTERGTVFQNLFNDVLGLMVATQRQHEDKPAIVPQDTYRRFYRKGRRISPATADLGSLFDRWPSEF